MPSPEVEDLHYRGALFEQAVKTARSLNEDVIALNDFNSEYVRGQAELLCDLFGIDMDLRDDVARRLLPALRDTTINL